MYFDEATVPFDPPSLTLKIVLGVTGVMVIFLFAYPPLFVGAASVAAKSLF
jgi:hypothetical protein